MLGDGLRKIPRIDGMFRRPQWRSFSYVPLRGKLEVHLYQGRTKGSCPGTVAPDILIGPTWQSVQHGLATFSIFTIEEGLSWNNCYYFGHYLWEVVPQGQQNLA